MSKKKQKACLDGCKICSANFDSMNSNCDTCNKKIDSSGDSGSYCRYFVSEYSTNPKNKKAPFGVSGGCLDLYKIKSDTNISTNKDIINILSKKDKTLFVKNVMIDKPYPKNTNAIIITKNDDKKSLFGEIVGGTKYSC